MATPAHNAQKCFIIEGNIGAGKSTFLKIVKEYLNVQVVFEPHEQWQQVTEGENLLEKFYTDTKRWAYTFQTYAFVTRVVEQEKHARQNPYGVQILERSVFSDRYCFAKTAHALGNMSALEWKLYQEWFSWLVEGYLPKPAGFIYLRTEPTICHQRLIKRNRHEESCVSLDYLQQLHDEHEAWLMHKKGVADYIQDVPVLVLPCDKDFEHNKREQEQHIEKIVNFIGANDLIGMPAHAGSKEICL